MTFFTDICSFLFYFFKVFLVFPNYSVICNGFFKDDLPIYGETFA